MGKHRVMRGHLQDEGRAWAGDRVAVTSPGRRNNFCKSLERKVSEFLESLSVVCPGGGGGVGGVVCGRGKKVRVSDSYCPHLTTKQSFFALTKLNVLSVVYGIIYLTILSYNPDTVLNLALQHTKVFPLTLKRPCIQFFPYL